MRISRSHRNADVIKSSRATAHALTIILHQNTSLGVKTRFWRPKVFTHGLRNFCNGTTPYTAAGQSLSSGEKGVVSCLYMYYYIIIVFSVVLVHVRMTMSVAYPARGSGCSSTPLSSTLFNYCNLLDSWELLHEPESTLELARKILLETTPSGIQVSWACVL